MVADVVDELVFRRHGRWCAVAGHPSVRRAAADVVAAMLTGRKYRLELTAEQAEFAEEVGAVCRSVWNAGLEQRREYRRRGAWMNYTPQAAELADAKADHDWLKIAPSHVLQQTLMDLDRACREHGTWNVKWRSGRRWSPSFRFPAGNLIEVQRLGRKWGRAKLPKLGWVRFRWSRALGGAVRSATVSRDGKHWYISFLVEDGRTTPERHVSASAVGVDRGVVIAVACSDGAIFDRPFTTTAERRRHLRLQQKLARQKKGSANRADTVAAIGRLRRRERQRRRDFCAQVAHRLASRHGTVVLEDLRTKNMTASAKGTRAEPGRNVTQKAGLNRAILDKGWNLFELALQNVARQNGCQVVKVPAAFTSQTCSRCRAVDPASRESQARFRCTACGYSENADLNAASNILYAAGHAVSACRGPAVQGRRSRNHQPSPVGVPRL